ncbi:MAG TPA: hypothetical protein VMX11_09810 [Actinomycetes bacterium]|nr:hypothetical protein [Actinomycetes bacterium]
MTPSTRQLWDAQNRHPGDRQSLFLAVAEALPIETVLYPGSYVDVAASFVFSDVTYNDSDRRAAKFFDDRSTVDGIIAESIDRTDQARTWTFIPGDYTRPLNIPTDHYDLLVSLYAGFVSEYCTQYVRPGGWLLVNASHGDAALASITNGYTLVGVIQKNGTTYRYSTEELDSYLQPKRPTEITRELLHATNRGVAYTKSPAAYVFQHSVTSSMP